MMKKLQLILMIKGMKIIERGFEFEVPDNECFRFQDCKGYFEIQNHFREVDLCWFSKEKNTLYLIELKDWSVFSKNETDKSEGKVFDLLKKSIDSLCMIHSILLNKPYSEKITSCMPFMIDGNTKIRIHVIVNWENDDINRLSTINTEYKSMFNAYSTLFNVKANVLTKTKAKEKFNWIA